MKTTVDLLAESPFFEVFGPGMLERIADLARLQSVRAGEIFVRAGDEADTLYMLVVGSVQLFFPTDEDDGSVPTAPEDERYLFVRTISEPGRPIGWSAMVEPYHYRASAIATEDSQLLAFDREWLERLAQEEPEFGVRLMSQILWVLGNRLRESRVRLVAQRYERVTLAVRAVIEQNAEQIAVTSPLHKVPFYLDNRLTLSDAFHTLELLHVHGDEVERNLADLCLDILEDIHKELDVYQRLQAIYEHVANSPTDVSPSEVRLRCCEEFSRLFDEVDYVIRGYENLPDEPGNIVIMNHLQNHPENTLPNEFILSLDTHFVSCMLLMPKYGDSPIRVIRKSKPDEYGHQAYYDRLGYIYVYAGHVDPDEENPKLLAEERRRNFYLGAKSYLLDGKNIVICPEGTSRTTETSPTQFKAGAFRLATLVRPEPYIVPIAVANFDKKLTTTTVAAIVGEPFRISERLPNPVDNETLFAFVDELQRGYRSLIDEAVELAARSESDKVSRLASR